MPTAQELSRRILFLRYPALSGAAIEAGGGFAAAATTTTGSAPDATTALALDQINADDLRRLISSTVKTADDISLIFTLAQASMPFPYFYTHFNWPAARHWINRGLRTPEDVRELDAALIEMANTMHLLIETALCDDRGAVHAIRLSAVLVMALRDALHGFNGSPSPKALECTHV